MTGGDQMRESVIGGRLAGLGLRAAAALVALALAGAVAQVARAPVARADASGRGGDFVPLTPSGQLLDTRSGIGGVTGARGPASTTVVTALGKAGIPTSNVRALMVDVTTVGPTAGTFLVLWADGTPRPPISMLNALAGQVISNSAVVPVGADGKIDVYNSAGSTHVVVDVQGYFTQISSGASGQGGYVPVPATRLVDTRTGQGAPRAAIASGGSLTVTVATGPVPATANAVFVNLIVPSATAGGWIGAFPAGGSTKVSLLDFVAGTTDTGGTVKVGTGGKITLVNHSGAAVNVALDVQGYFVASTTQGAGLRNAAARLLDTRSTAPVAASGTIDVAVGGTNGLPTRGIAGAALDLKIIDPAQGGFLRAWPVGDPEPTTSDTNFPAGNNARDALAVVRPGVEGKVRIRNLSSASVNLAVDLQGWFADPIPAVPVEQDARVTAIQATPVPGASVGTLEYAYTDNIGRLLHGHQGDLDDFTSLQWTVISGSDAFSGQPALAEQADGRLQVSAQNVDADVWVDTEATKSPPAWSPSFTSLGGSMSSPPALVRAGDGTLVAFAVDADGRLWYIQQGGANGAYGSWHSLGAAGLAGAPAAVAVSNGIQVFARDSGGALRTALFSGGTLSAWTSLGGSGLTGTPAVVINPGWILRVLVRAGDGSIQTKKQDSAGAWPQSWDVVGTFTAEGSPAALLSPVTGKTEVVARATDGTLWSTGETAPGSATWRDWVNVSIVNPSTGLPEVAATDPTSFAVSGATYSWAFVFIRDDGARRVYTVSESLTAGPATGAAAPAVAAHTLPGLPG